MLQLVCSQRLKLLNYSWGATQSLAKALVKAQHKRFLTTPRAMHWLVALDSSLSQPSIHEQQLPLDESCEFPPKSNAGAAARPDLVPGQTPA